MSTFGMYTKEPNEHFRTENILSEIENSFGMFKEGNNVSGVRNSKNQLAQILRRVNTSPSYPMINDIEEWEHFLKDTWHSLYK